ncbi:MAG: ATP-binding cassette domain-containing protein, partial [Candidatus Margulisiibacteriota bacterium]
SNQLNALDNLLYFGALQDLPPSLARKRALESLRIVGLGDEADKLVYRFSSGMKQRLNIAKGIINDPKLILMDEPTRGLDPGISNDLLAYVKEVLVRQQGKTVLLSTHNQSAAQMICDSMIVLEKGRLKGVFSRDQLVV